MNGTPASQPDLARYKRKLKQAKERLHNSQDAELAHMAKIITESVIDFSQDFVSESEQPLILSLYQQYENIFIAKTSSALFGGSRPPEPANAIRPASLASAPVMAAPAAATITRRKAEHIVTAEQPGFL